MDPVTPESEPITYGFDMGAEWSRIRLDDNAESDVKALLDIAFTGIPPEAAEPTRNTLIAQFTKQIAAARSRRGIDLYVPTPKPHGQRIPAAAILAAEVVIPTRVVLDPADVVARVVATSQVARAGSIAGSPAVRLDHAAAEGAGEAEAEVGTVADYNATKAAAETAIPANLRIEYVIAVPDDPRWLSLDLSVQAIPGHPVEPTLARFDEAVAALTFSR
jgi:hypothetical protein